MAATWPSAFASFSKRKEKGEEQRKNSKGEAKRKNKKRERDSEREGRRENGKKQIKNKKAFPVQCRKKGLIEHQNVSRASIRKFPHRESKRDVLPDAKIDR